MRHDHWGAVTSHFTGLHMRECARQNGRVTNDVCTVIQVVLRVVLAVVFLGMGIAHFRPGARRPMARMIPPALRFDGVAKPANLVACTGVCEIAGGIRLLVPATRLAAGIWC